MSKQQLYINDVAVDMPADDIKIKVASNVLSDADKVMTAHSYNVALPRTMTNDNIFKLAYVVGANTGGKSTHRYLKASLYYDGVPLFDLGSAVLTSVDDKGYNLTLLWGVIGMFDEIKEEGLKVNELPLSKHWDETDTTLAQWITLAQNNQLVTGAYNSGMDSTIYATLDNDSKDTADKYPWWMPADSALNILTKIAKVYDITFTYSTLAQQRLQRYNHVATTLKTMLKGEEVSNKLYNTMIGSGNNYVISWNSDAIDYADNSNIWFNALEYDSGYYTYKAKVATSFKSIRVHGRRNINDFSLVFADAPDNVVDIQPTYNSETGMYEIDKTWHNASLDEGHYMPAFSVLSQGVPLGDTLFYMDVVIDEVADGKVGYKWEYTRNAPDLKIIDYISECLAHIGGFIVGSVTGVSTIKIMTFDEVAQATPKSIDITGVSSITMSIDDLAQNNRYLHAENNDEEAQGLSPYYADGVIYDYDSTLEKERDAFKSDFKVPRTNKILHWKVEKNENANDYKATWQDAGKNIVGFDLATFKYLNNGQSFGYIIDNYYGEYRKAVRMPKMVEVVTRMSILDLLKVDFTKPVYINQLASAFLIVDISNDNKDTYKLKLIKI